MMGAARVAGLCAALLGLTTVVGCSWFDGGFRRQTWRDVSECPHYWSRLGVGKRDSVASLAGAHVDVPEYNDCQRLLVPDSSHAMAHPYGPLSAVFASARLSSLLADQQARSASLGKPVAVAAATVLAIKGDYRWLGLAQGANCLYLWKTGDRWAARMVPVAGSGGACQNPLDLSVATVGMDLDVQATSPPSGSIPPAVARWELDDRDGQVIGLLCGDQWCRVGPPGFRPRVLPDVTTDPALDSWLASLPGEVAAPVTGARLRDLVLAGGWADEQLLSRPGGGAEASRIWGMIIPHPALDAMTDAAFAGAWRVSAFVYMGGTGDDATVLGYRHKLNFDLGWSALAVCKGAACPGIPAHKCAPPTSGDQWYGAVISMSAPAGTRPETFCVTRIGHDLMGHIIGAARWRWLLKDETTWTRCVDGCCEVQPKA